MKSKKSRVNLCGSSVAVLVEKASALRPDLVVTGSLSDLYRRCDFVRGYRSDLENFIAFSFAVPILEVAFRNFVIRG